MANYGAIQQAARTIREELEKAVTDGDMDPKFAIYFRKQAENLMDDIDKNWKGL